MSWKFNPPPGWPVPEGWQPPAGYVPDPSWPPAPPGWQYWIPEESTSPGTPAPEAVPPSAPPEAPPSTPPAQPPPSPPPQFPAAQPPPFPVAQPQPFPVAAPWYQRWWAIAGAFLIVLLLGCAIGGLLATLAG